MQNSNTAPLCIGIASMPWSIFNRPSIQLASLKAYLDQNSNYQTDLFHPYLQVAANIGAEHYHYLALNSWAGEALYAPLLFPEQRDAAEKLFYEECKNNPVLQKLHFQACLDALQQSLEQWIDSLDLKKYSLFGFSICFNQLLATLTAAKRIKKIRPDLRIVVGGSGCVGEIGSSLLQNFPQINYVINGEGEEALLQLADCMATESDELLLPATVLSKGNSHSHTCAKGIEDLNSLPLPNYSSYFLEMRQHFPDNNFIPVLPLEFSRGCWWNKCKFCNLNLQWRGYRKKTAATVLQEVKEQAKRHQCLDFCFTDNALPPKETDSFFASLAQLDADYDFFAEVRVITKPDVLKQYRQGGLTSIQVGIEALASSLLKKMDKGTRCIENIAAMRQSAEAGITLDGNLICEFPGSSKEEVEETLTTLDFVLPFTPLSSATFFLGHGSPVALNPKSHGITAIVQHTKNQKLFPPELLQNLTMLIKGYRGDKTEQQKLWKPVHKKIQQWQDFHKNRENTQSPLSYRDGGNFLLIRQERRDAPPLRHRLHGTSREIYLFCCDIRSIDAIQKKFLQIKQSNLRTFLNDLVTKKILFTEDDLFLALAIKP
jgi:ribosomal peptide maturation radical SAM protein 1